MKTSSASRKAQAGKALRASALIVVALVGFLSANLAGAVLGSAFTYQGRLSDGGAPGNGIYDLRFTIYDAATSGNVVGASLTNSAVAVSNGLFTVALDFGANAFNGDERWLEIAVRTNGSADAYQTLSSRQQLTSTPYATTAANLAGGGLSGIYSNAVTLNNAANNFSGSGAGLTGLNASQLSSGTVSDARLSAAVALRNATNAFGNFINTFAGRVGIGTSTPQGQLHVIGATGTGGGAGAGIILTAGNGESAGVVGSGSSGGAVLLTAGGGGAPGAFGSGGNGGNLTLQAGNGVPNYTGLTGGNGGNILLKPGTGGGSWVPANGKVGIGKDDPATMLDVNGAVTALGFIGDGSGLTNLNAATLTNVARLNANQTFSGTNTFTKSVVLSSGAPNLKMFGPGGAGAHATLDLSTYDPGTNAPSARIQTTDSNWGSDWDFYGKQQGANTNALVSLLHISADGNVGIGATAPNFKLEVNGSAAKPGGGSWSTASDARLKKNITQLTNALEHLLAIRGVNFEYKDPQTIHELPGTRTGVIAQDVEKVFPDWVDTASDGYKRVTFRGFEGVTIEALRELQSRNETLREENAALAARLMMIERKLDELGKK